MVHYIDTSALVKLVVAEAESATLVDWIEQEKPEFVSSDLTRTELLRAVRRAAPARVVRARTVLDSITLVSIATATFESAARLESDILRTLDAVHIAAALELGDDLAALVAYDSRLIEAARANGIATVTPI